MTLKTKLKRLGECKMGLTHVVVRLFNSASSDTYESDFFVDTGAMYTMAPASELKRIGIQPLGRNLYELANGELVEFEYGNAEIRFMNEVIPTRILFGPEGCEPILGVIALESAGFIVDPTNRRLRRLLGLPLKRVA